MQELIAKLEELLNTTEIYAESKLDSFEEWDSLSMIAIISFASKHYQTHITLDDLAKCSNIQDICNLVINSNGGGGINRKFHKPLLPHYLKSLTYPIFPINNLVTKRSLCKFAYLKIKG